ncbi:MAG: GxxExxY protein [Bacteroidia bacterium]
MSEFEKDILTEKIIACCFEVHNALGAGFLEKVYHNALIIVFKKRGILAESEKEFVVMFEGANVGKFRSDFFIEEKVILEIKALTGIMPIIFQYKMLSYLKSSGVKTGLLVNFGNKSVQVKRFSK